MWTQNYVPLGDSLWWSTPPAALPIGVLLYLLGIRRRPSWVAALAGLGSALLIALAVYRMPPGAALGAVSFGAAFGLFPITWIVFNAIFLYRITVETGQFQIIQDSLGNLTHDRRLQALLIAFAFGAFVEGAAGFGAPVAVAAAMLTGLGFSPFYAAGICLLANTAPVAFGSIGIPVITLAGITGLPLDQLSAAVGRICAPVSLIVPAYLVGVMGGWNALAGVLPAVVTCGISFALVQFLVSNYVGPQLTDILSSLAAIGAMVLVMRIWTPHDDFVLAGDHLPQRDPVHHRPAALIKAWSPYLLLVVFVLAWGNRAVSSLLVQAGTAIPWPRLHEAVVRMPPVTPEPTPYAAIYQFNWLSAAGTACLAAALSSCIILGVGPRQGLRILRETARQMALPALTISSVLALAFLMNYCGATATLGLAFAATGMFFPFFSALLGWLGVFLTGSDTSANALFGNLQVVTAQHLGLSPVLMAAGNSAGGVMGKMISLQSLAVAVAATGLAAAEESRLFRFTLRHSILLAALIGLVVTAYAYVVPGWVP
jgi:lactate permease